MNNSQRIVPLRFEHWSVLNEYAGAWYEVLSHHGLGVKLNSTRVDAFRPRMIGTECACCQSPLRSVYDSGYEDDLSIVRDFYLACEACGFWRHAWQTDVGGIYVTVPYAVGFTGSSEMPSLARLVEVVARDPRRVYSMNPRQFEIFVGSVLSEYFDCEVHHVGQSGDDGVDLMAIVGDEPLLVQVKRRSAPESVEGIEVVKLLFASGMGQGARDGMVVTTAQRFSSAAIRWTHLPTLRDLSFRMKLVDMKSLLSMVNAIRSGGPEPWEEHAAHQLQDDDPSKDAWTSYRLSDGFFVRCEREGKAVSFVFSDHIVGSCVEIIDKIDAPLDAEALDVAGAINAAHRSGNRVERREGGALGTTMRMMPETLLAEIARAWQVEFPYFGEP